MSNFTLKKTNFFSIEDEILKKVLFNIRELQKKILIKIDYKKFVKISSSHLIIPLIYSRLKRKNYINYLPQDLRSYLNQIYCLNRERNEILVNEVKEISKILNSHMINHVFIKGVSNIFSQIYQDPAERMVGDIDFLIEKKIQIE